MSRLIVFLALFALSCSEPSPISPASAPPATHIDCEETFDIDLVFLDGERPLTEVHKVLIQSAARRWEAMITDDLPDMSFRSESVNEYSPFLGARVRISDVVDDVRIFFRVKTLANNTAGSAWVSWLRREGKLPIVAELVIDPDHLDSDYFYQLVQHEIGHCLGFGSIWSNLDLLKRPSSSGFSDPYFAGKTAHTRYLSLLGWPDDWEDTFPPVQAGGDDSHWRTAVFGDELMVRGWVSPYNATISSLTLSSMRDLGYEVNWFAADERYVLPSPQAGKVIAEKAQPLCHIERRPSRSR